MSISKHFELVARFGFFLGGLVGMFVPWFFLAGAGVSAASIGFGEILLLTITLGLAGAIAGTIACLAIAGVVALFAIGISLCFGSKSPDQDQHSSTSSEPVKTPTFASGEHKENTSSSASYREEDASVTYFRMFPPPPYTHTLTSNNLDPSFIRTNRPSGS